MVLRLTFHERHTESRDATTNPVRISLSGPGYIETALDSIGTRLASCLQDRVIYGDVTYLGKDDFQFTEHQSFLPGVGRRT
jgi:hypothetical protein